MEKKKTFLELLKENWMSLVPYIIFIVLTAVMARINPNTLSMRWMANKADAAFSLVLVTVGQTLVLLTGGFDLSVGGVVSVTNSLLTARMSDQPAVILFWILICVVIGFGIGVFNGFIVEKTGMQPFIVTLVTQFICLGAALLILKIDGGNVNAGFINILMHRFGGVPLSLIMLIVLIVWWIYVRRTKFGLALYAIGSNEKTAHLSGIPIMKTKVLAYGLSGLFASFAGIYRTAHMASGSPTAGAAFTMSSIAAAVVGGTAITGGVGGVIGGIVGAFILRGITDLLVFIEVPSYWTSLVQGVLLLAAVAITSYAKLRKSAEVRL